MANLVTKHLAGLFNGVSQQAPTLRLDTQAEEQINGWSSLTHGLTSRPPTKFIKTMGWELGSKFHAIKRDREEQYILNVGKHGDISVANLSGYSYHVEVGGAFRDYLTSNDPLNDIAMTTISDYTLVVNKNKTIEMQVTDDSLIVNNEARCKVALYTVVDATYSLIIDGVTVASTQGTKDDGTGTSTLKSAEEVLSGLREQVNIMADLSATLVQDNAFYFVRTDGKDFVATSALLDIEYTEASTANLLYDNVAYIYVAKGVADQTYEVILEDTPVASYTTGNTSKATTYKTDVIASNLYSGLVNAGYQCALAGSVIKLWKADGSDFSFAVHDSWGDLALKGFKGTAQSFNDLPAKCFEGATLQIIGKTSTDEGSYWVKYATNYAKDGSLVETTGTWKETRAPNKLHQFVSSTMPVQVVRRQDKSMYLEENNPYGIYFSVEPCSWEERKVGDETSAPAPSFVGQSISDIFLFANRLGVLSGTSVCLTRAGDFFNFFPATVTDSLDDEPIDMDVPSSDVSNVYHAVASKDYLMLFSENSQFLMDSGGEPMTPTTANITQILKYPSDINIAPLAIGQSAFYVSPRGKYMSLREYFIQSEGMVTDAPNVAQHIPYYIRGTSTMQMVGIPNEDILFIADGTNKLYVYKYNWSGDQKTQSSWSMWEFGRDITTILEFNNSLYIYFSTGDLEVLEFEYEQLPLLDSIGGPVSYPYNFKYSFSPLYLREGDGLGEITGSSIYTRLVLYFERSSSLRITAHNMVEDRTRVSYQYTKKDSKTPYISESFLLQGDSKETSIVIENNGTDPVSIQSASFELRINNRARGI